MPEVRDWRKRQEAAKTKREKVLAEGGEVEEVEDIPWSDADIDVSSILYPDPGATADDSGTPLRIPRSNENLPV